MSEARAYFKLSFGPAHYGWFDNHADMHKSLPAFRDHLVEIGALKLDSQGLMIVPPGEKPTAFQVDAVEMTPEEYQAIPASDAPWMRQA